MLVNVKNHGIYEQTLMQRSDLSVKRTVELKFVGFTKILIPNLNMTHLHLGLKQVSEYSDIWDLFLRFFLKQRSFALSWQDRRHQGRPHEFVHLCQRISVGSWGTETEVCFTSVLCGSEHTWKSFAHRFHPQLVWDHGLLVKVWLVFQAQNWWTSLYSVSVWYKKHSLSSWTHRKSGSSGHPCCM